MANAYHQRIGLPGVRQGDDGPFPRSLEHAVMQGKVRGGPRFTSFGVRDGLVCQTRLLKYCQNGGMAFDHHPALACQGSKMAMMPLPAVPRTRRYAGESPWGP
jgi:hypothetical protein